MIKTTYDIDFKIDDKSFKIEVHELSKQQQKDLEKSSHKTTKLVEEMETKNEQIKNIQEEMTIDKEIADSTDDTAERISILKANKEKLKEITTLKNDVKAIIKKLESLDIDDLLEKRFDISVSGEAKELKEYLKEKNVRFAQFFEVIGDEIAEQQKK
jgi:FMN phosphatase YigB (HAD superfamily)